MFGRRRGISAVFGLAALGFVTAGCASLTQARASKLQLAPQEQEGLNAALATPLTFTVPKADGEAAWARAQNFIVQYSSMKIQLATDYVIQTFTPTGSWPSFGYNITREPQVDTEKIMVSCLFSNDFSANDASVNAHLAAYFIRTGELPCIRCIDR